MLASITPAVHIALIITAIYTCCVSLGVLIPAGVAQSDLLYPRTVQLKEALDLHAQQRDTM